MYFWGQAELNGPRERVEYLDFGWLWGIVQWFLVFRNNSAFRNYGSNGPERPCTTSECEIRLIDSEVELWDFR